MPRYFFQVLDGSGLIDEDGHELSDIQVAKCEAVKLAGQLICDASSHFWERQDWEMRVTDEKGLILFTLVFAGYEAPSIRSH